MTCAQFLTVFCRLGLLAPDDYENPSFWTAQMFPTGWAPGSIYSAPHYESHEGD